MSWPWLLIPLVALFAVLVGYDIGYREGWKWGRLHGRAESIHPGEITRPLPDRRHP